VRCSSCEPLLDEYVDATLSNKQMHAIAAHLHECEACEAMHRRLRIVDGLLHTRAMIDVPSDFTDGVMAQIRALPVPHAPRRSLGRLALYYLVAAWAALGLTFAFYNGAASRFAHVLGSIADAGWQALVHGVHALGPVAPVAVPVGVGVLFVDALLIAATVVFYRVVRPRLAAQSDSEPEVTA
jgi:anti-sigma factor RsiW